MSGIWQRAGRVLAGTLIVFLAGCGTKSISVNVPPGNKRPPLQLGHALPFPADRTISTVTKATLRGFETEEQSANALTDGTAIRLPAAGNEAEYALYRFNLADAEFDGIEIALDDVPTSAAWVAIANYSTGRWDFFGPFAKGTFIATNGANYRSSLDNIYVAVLTFDGNAAKVDELGFPGVAENKAAYAADTLYAVPLQAFVEVDQPVTVVIATGVPAHGFEYMVGCGLTIDSDATYVPLSFDIGVPDSNPNPRVPIDGIWAAMQPGDFLVAQDNFIQSTDLGGGRELWNFNVTPVAGSTLITESGALFSARFKFSTPGVKTFGFHLITDTTKRTYYSDGTTEFNWADIANDGSTGLRTKVTVADTVTQEPNVTPDTLYARPVEAILPVQQPVTLVVGTGVPANPFRYMSAVGITVESDASYVAGSFNPGAVGGDQIDFLANPPDWTGPADGIWGALAVTDFDLAPQSAIQATDIGGGRERWDFSLTPIGGHPKLTLDGGALFNVQFDFATEGTKTFGFQVNDGVDRTFYSDADSDYSWGDASNATSDDNRNSVFIFEDYATSLEPDTLYAIPLEDSAEVDEPVTVLVATGSLANPFRYMSGIGLTIESSADYVAHSFNIGNVGGDSIGQGGWTGPADGIWDALAPTGFIFTSEGSITSSSIGGGRERWDFNITPLGSASDLTDASGVLFNLQFRFSTAGVKTFGFQESDGVDRTYYNSDAAPTDYFWADISNDGTEGVQNSVTIE